MAATAYILINTEVGKGGDVAKALRRVEGVKTADSVTGPYDAIATVLKLFNQKFRMIRKSPVLPLNCSISPL
jgi:hypothetical protein